MTTSTSESTRWVTVYPAYLSVKRTLKQGRRVPKSLAIDTPLAQEIHDICKASGLEVELQKGKMYPRDQNRDMHFQGRCKVYLFDNNGAPINAEITSPQMIPKLKTRQQRTGATASTDAPSTSNAGGSKKKKK